VYFEARGEEAVRGQIAVAQVVLNRAFSGKYPDTVCGVVYRTSTAISPASSRSPATIIVTSSATRYVDRAQKISKAMLDGRLWLPEVDRSTHYHAVGAAVLGERNEEDVQIRRPHLLSPTRLGRRAVMRRVGATRRRRRKFPPSSPKPRKARPNWPARNAKAIRRDDGSGIALADLAIASPILQGCPAMTILSPPS
jgi:hypothetical protein